MTGDADGLERALAASGLGDIEIVARRHSGYRTSFPIEEVELARIGGAPTRIVCKRLDWEALDATARLAKPRFLHDPKREARVYEELLPRGPAGPPRFLGAVRERDRHWLFLEWVDGRNLFQVGERRLWEEAARWLARFHCSLASASREALDEWRLIDRDASFYRRWMVRAREFDARSQRLGSALEWLAERHEAVVEALTAMHQTVIHGEFYAGNVLIDDAPISIRVAPLDWELAGTGPGLLDLAALVSGWPRVDREAMREAYSDALADGSVAPEDLELARLQVAIQWLGWAPPEWEPPSDQRHDWGAEAIEIAESLEL